MKEAGFTDVRTSINRRQNTVVQYIATRPLLDLCRGMTQIGGDRMAMRWWDQKGIDWGKEKARGRRRNQNKNQNRRQTWKKSRHGTQTVGRAARVGRNGVERVYISGK